MTLKTRLIILGMCVVAFFIVAPYIVLYSLGYRVNLTTFKITTTGGIYVKALPEPLDITIDSKLAGRTGLFSSSIFVQNLLPGLHQVLIKKEGYYDYQKNLPVQEKEVTKLENVILFKKDITFTKLADIPATTTAAAQTAEQQFIKLTQKPITTVPTIKNMMAYVINDSNITWLSKDGFLYESTAANTTPQKITSVPFPLKTKANYQLIIIEDFTFLQENTKLFWLEATTKTFQPFYDDVKQLKNSPDNQKILYVNDHQIFIDKVLLDIYIDTINDVSWLNSDYIIVSAGDSIVISEIDNRGNINKVAVPNTVKTPAIFFRQEDKKLYILNQKEVLVSERLVP